MGRQGDTSETVKPATAVKTASEQINWRAIRGRAKNSLSSSAKADDPVNAGVSAPANAAEYWMPRLRGA